MNDEYDMRYGEDSTDAASPQWIIVLFAGLFMAAVSFVIAYMYFEKYQEDVSAGYTDANSFTHMERMEMDRVRNDILDLNKRVAIHATDMRNIAAEHNKLIKDVNELVTGLNKVAQTVYQHNKFMGVLTQKVVDMEKQLSKEQAE